MYLFILILFISISGAVGALICIISSVFWRGRLMIRVGWIIILLFFAVIRARGCRFMSVYRVFIIFCRVFEVSILSSIHSCHLMIAFMIIMIALLFELLRFLEFSTVFSYSPYPLITHLIHRYLG